MNKILSLRTDEQDFFEERDKVVTRYPAELQASVRKAFQAADRQDLEKAAGICCKLLDFKAEPEIRMLLGTCYFMQEHMQAARQVFSDLTVDYPKNEEYRIYLGITDHALGRFEEAVKELGSTYPLSEYRPFYYTSYGNSLQQVGRLKQSCEAFRREAEYFEKTGTIVSAEQLDGAFQNLLYLDITLGNGNYQEDVKLYYEFLNQTEMTKEMQGYLAGNIVYFCSLMRNKWYQPLFLEFITHIRNKRFLTNEDSLKVLESGFASWESYAYHEDRQISAMMEAYLAAGFERKYSKDNTFIEVERDRIEVTALSYEWYMCQYAPEHPEEISYVRDHYPYVYADNKEFFEKVNGDSEGMAEKVIDELHPYVQGKSRQEFNVSMHNAYKKACANKKESMYVYDGMETYRRIMPKVGRNDACPCGSGKKYKKCCGK